jgi:hypothetical protein
VQCVDLLGRIKVELDKLVDFFDSLTRVVAMVRDVQVPQFVRAITAEVGGADKEEGDFAKAAFTRTGQ